MSDLHRLLMEHRDKVQARIAKCREDRATAINEIAHILGLPTPEYNHDESEGRFCCTVTFKNREGIILETASGGWAHNKPGARRFAAAALLTQLGLIGNTDRARAGDLQPKCAAR